MNISAFCIFCYKQRSFVYTLYALLVCCMIIVSCRIEHYVSNMQVQNTALATKLAQHKKEYAVLCKMQQSYEQLLNHYTTQTQCFKNLSLKETCALLFAECSGYAIDLVSYAYQLSSDHTTYHATAHLKGDYHSIIDFCKAIYTRFASLQCHIASLRRSEINKVEAQIVLDMYRQL